MLGYLNKPEENASVFIEKDGMIFFRTGDKGYLDEHSHLYITGRYKRLMKQPDGHQVSPIPVENAIAKHPMVADCAVVGLKRESLRSISGEREMALAYRIIDAIPYTENGKMNYRALEQHDFSDGTYYVIDDPITRAISAEWSIL